MEYDEQSFHGGLFSGPQVRREFFEVIHAAQLDVGQPDNRRRRAFRRQCRRQGRSGREQVGQAREREREDRREQQRRKETFPQGCGPK